MSRCDKGAAMPAVSKRAMKHKAATPHHLQGSLVWLRLAAAGNRAARHGRARRATLFALASLTLGGCDLHSNYYTHIPGTYLDRRETLSLGGGDAVATNKILQTQDPWPVVAANRNLTTHGHVAAGAMERYRTGKVIQPVGMSTSSANYQQQGQAQGNGSSLSAVPIGASQASP